MSTLPHRPVDVPCRSAQREVNARIRTLMAQPADERRAAEYVRLLALWAAATAPGDAWARAA